LVGDSTITSVFIIIVSQNCSLNYTGCVKWQTPRDPGRPQHGSSTTFENLIIRDAGREA